MAKRLGLYSLSQDPNAYSFRGFVVCAESASDALLIILQDYNYQGVEWSAESGEWVTTRIGSAHKSAMRGVIIRTLL